MNFVSLQKFLHFLDQLGLWEIVILILKQLPTTPRCPMYRGVETLKYFVSQNSPVSYVPGVANLTR